MGENTLKHTLVITSFITSFLFVFTSCIPTNNAASNSDNTSNARKERTVSRETTTVSNNPQNNNANPKNNNGGQVRKNSNRQRNTNGENVRTIPRSNENNKHRVSSNPFEKRQHALKHITKEDERFAVDTTYYLLTMEDGVTKTTSSSVNSAGYANNQEFRENLIRSFDATIAEFEQSILFDCSMFKIFSSQFSFNDSLRQTAIFYYAECCVVTNNLEEAVFVLEALSKEKMNRTVAPKVIVRLGQLHCVTGDIRQADRYFKRLKKEYPRSIYNQVADCSRL